MPTTPQQPLRGTGVSSGIAQGTAYVLTCTRDAAAPLRAVQPAEVNDEIARFEAALTIAEKELAALRLEVADRLGSTEAEIFTAQALVLRDQTFHGQVADLITNKHINAEGAVNEVIERFTRTFDEIPDPYFRERAADIRDVGRRVLAALIEERNIDVLAIPEGSVVVTDELLPSATARLELDRVKGFVTERGGKFSHAAILARSMRTPAVTAVPLASLSIKTGDHLIVDGVSGMVFRNPDKAVQREYDRLEAELRGFKQELQQLIDVAAVTRDGTPIGLYANVSKFSDTESADLYHADGIGLYRTEFGYSVRHTFPSEDEQYEVAKRAAERFHPRPIAFRLLDIGGDKELPYFPLPPTRNPSLADRGIRLLLKHPEILRKQVRALLRVSAEHPISILLPVVTGIEEVRAARRFISTIQDELRAEGKASNPEIRIGAMIEVPSAALLAPALAREVDFFSLGTNDLVQYVLAADREDETVASYYQPLHPAVLRLISLVCEAAIAARRDLSICGEMAGDPAYTELLLGLGLRQFSVAPGEMLDVKNAIRKADLTAAQALARKAAEAGSVADVVALLAERRLLAGA
jgi:phosphotransferase system enzyme I (PtsI)